MSRPNTLPRVSVGSLGGTVSMQPDGERQGVTPSLDCEALLRSVPQLADLAQVRARTLCLQPSASLDVPTLLDALSWAQREVEAGARAVVLTQGTDTLEETAYFLDLLWPCATPLVMTGALRSARQPGADGPGNLLAAVQVALAECSRGRGVQVVLNDTIHHASQVRKTASLALAAFESPGVGPEGVVVEGVAQYHRAARARAPLPVPTGPLPPVALLEACLGADTDLLWALPELGYAGVVIAGFGAGHVSHAWAEALGELAAQMPVVVATRTGSGPTARSSYGFVGGEIDLQARGVHMAGALCPRKCRILLGLLLACGNVGLLEGWLR
nr:asparaginase [uncultured Pseudomonas sp.]